MGQSPNKRANPRAKHSLETAVAANIIPLRLRGAPNHVPHETLTSDQKKELKTAIDNGLHPLKLEALVSPIFTRLRNMNNADLQKEAVRGDDVPLPRTFWNMHDLTDAALGHAVDFPEDLVVELDEMASLRTVASRKACRTSHGCWCPRTCGD
jgi:hypothetical protein